MENFFQNPTAIFFSTPLQKIPVGKKKKKRGQSKISIIVSQRQGSKGNQYFNILPDLFSREVFYCVSILKFSRLELKSNKYFPFTFLKITFSLARLDPSASPGPTFTFFFFFFNFSQILDISKTISQLFMNNNDNNWLV